MSSFADNAARRIKKYQDEQMHVLRRDGDWHFEFEPTHELLNGPRLIVTMPVDATAEEAQQKFDEAGWLHVYNRFAACTNHRSRSLL